VSACIVEDVMVGVAVCDVPICDGDCVVKVEAETSSVAAVLVATLTVV
jgi:hypothetical protein